ncbi:MAG: hypothetical protein JXR88_09310 [Clostridia bacterium]|nr:hypothetical protein [Clostridia bacterium]
MYEILVFAIGHQKYGLNKKAVKGIRNMKNLEVDKCSINNKISHQNQVSNLYNLRKIEASQMKINNYEVIFLSKYNAAIGVDKIYGYKKVNAKNLVANLEDLSRTREDLIITIIKDDCIILEISDEILFKRLEKLDETNKIKS